MNVFLCIFVCLVLIYFIVACFFNHYFTKKIKAIMMGIKIKPVAKLTIIVICYLV